MKKIQSVTALTFSLIVLSISGLAAQTRPDFSGVWRLDPAESRMIGGLGERQITWLVNHREPEIGVVVNVQDGQESHEFSFQCTTDGRTCVNELPEIGEERRMSAVWKDDVLVMTQQANTPHGEFEAKDRLSISDSGERLVFERLISNELGERSVRLVFWKFGPHP